MAIEQEIIPYLTSFFSREIGNQGGGTATPKNQAAIPLILATIENSDGITETELIEFLNCCSGTQGNIPPPNGVLITKAGQIHNTLTY